MKKTTIRFLPVLVIISLVLSIVPNYGQYMLVEAQVSNAVQVENSGSFSSALTGKITFVSNRDGIDEIYSMNTDGSNQVRLTGTNAANCDPAISPDGYMIVFQSFRDGPNPEIYVMHIDGTNQVRLTNDAAYEGRPVWTPDGNGIVFDSNLGGNNNIYVMNKDGTNPVRLTNSSFSDQQPACWSPDGTRIAFASVAFASTPGDGTDGNEIYTMNFDGSDKIRLTNNTKRDFEPAWSPDGTKIAFTSWRNNETEIFIMDFDGNNQTKLTSGANPTWSPDGTKIAFTSWYNGNPKIFVMNADGSNQTQLTNGTGLDSYPCWGVVNGIAPSLGDNSVNNVTTNSTALQGSLTSFGSASDAYVTVEWGKDNSSNVNSSLTVTQSSLGSFSFSSVSDGDIIPQSGEENIIYTNQTPPIKMSSTGNFSFNLTNLDPGTTYYFHSKAFRQGTSYSQEMSFKTKNLDGSGGSQVPSVKLTSSVNPSLYGQEVTFSATVTAMPPATGITTGSVTFNDAATTLGAGTLDSTRKATYVTSALSVGSHSITAVYSGDISFGSSTSSVLTQTVNKFSTTTLVFSISPGECKAGANFYTQPVIQLQDALGNVVNNYNAPVGLTISAGTGKNGALLSGTTTVNAINGIATFTPLSVNLANPAGNVYTLTATSGNFTATSSPFKVLHPGDANGDGEITMGDVTKVEREILTLDPLTCGADPNNDGVTTMGDVTKIERIILTLDPLQG